MINYIKDLIFSTRFGFGTHVCTNHDCDSDDFSNHGFYKVPYMIYLLGKHEIYFYIPFYILIYFH